MRKDQKSINTPHFTIQLAPTSGLNALNYSDLVEFQSDVMLFVKTVLYSSNFITVIEFMESKIDNFFVQYEDLKLFLLKIQFFHYILTNINQASLNQFYEEKIKPIIVKKINHIDIEQCLMCIRDNPSIVDSRYYLQMREECFRLFELSIQAAIEEIFSPKKKTSMSKKDYEYYVSNKGRLDTFEFDLVNQSSIVMIAIEKKKKVPLLKSELMYSDDIDYEMMKEDSHSPQLREIEPEECLNARLLNNNFLPFESNDFFSGNDINVDDDTFNNISSSDQTSINQINSNCYSLNALYDFRSPTPGPVFENRHTGPTNCNTTTLHHLPITRLTQPSIQKEKKSKLKKFQFRFTKRENIDKKILRKFRKFLSQRLKKNDEFIQGIVMNSDFWISFINKSLLPPFIYPPENKTFKSFNTRFMLWIFEHDNSFELYSNYVKANYQPLVDLFANKYNLKEGHEEFALLKSYITSFAEVFGNSTPNSLSTATKVTNDFAFEGQPSSKGEAKANEPLPHNDSSVNPIQKKTNDIFDEIITNDNQQRKGLEYLSYENEDIMMNYFDIGLNLNEYDRYGGFMNTDNEHNV